MKFECHFFTRIFFAPVEGLCCKPKYRENIIHHFIFVFIVYFFSLSSCLKDQFTVLNLKFVAFLGSLGPVA